MPYRKSLYLGGGRVYNAVQNKGHAGQVIFRSKHDYDYFVSLLRRELRAYPAVRLIGFCLLPSSYHLLLQEDKRGGVARFMHSLAVSYSIYFNARHQKTGKVFQGPYKDNPLLSEDDVMRSLCALHALPSSVSLSIEHYEWSSYRYYLRGLAPWVEKGFVATYFANSDYIDDLRRVTAATLTR